MSGIVQPKWVVLHEEGRTRFGYFRVFKDLHREKAWVAEIVLLPDFEVLSARRRTFTGCLAWINRMEVERCA